MIVHMKLYRGLSGSRLQAYLSENRSSGCPDPFIRAHCGRLKPHTKTTGTSTTQGAIQYRKSQSKGLPRKQAATTSVLQILPHPSGQLLNGQQRGLQALSLLHSEPVLDRLEEVLAPSHVRRHHIPQSLRCLRRLRKLKAEKKRLQ